MGVTCYEEHKNLQRKNIDLNNKNSFLEKENKELNNNINDYKNKENDLKQKIEQKELNEINLAQEILDYKIENQNLNKELKSEKDKNKQNQQEFQSLQNKMLNSQEEVKKEKKEKIQIQENLNKLKRDNDDLQKNNLVKDNKMKELESKKNNLEKELDSLKLGKLYLQKENDEFKHEIELYNDKINNLEKEKNGFKEQINTLQNEKNKNEKEKVDLEKQINIYQGQIKEKDNNMNEQLVKLNEQIEDLKNQNLITENEKKENEEYMKYLENKINNFISKLSVEEINLIIKEKCNNILQNETKKIKEHIEELISNINFLQLIEETKNKEIQKAINDFTRESKHINIIVLGKTGVGKSELVNSIARDKIADTGGFRPTKHKGTWHTIGSLKIYDYKGIEISKNNNNIDNIIKNIKNIIDTAKRSGKPDEFVHCIWYCVTGTRFEEEEESAIKKLRKIYEDRCMPLIIVYLRAICSEWVKNMEKGIKNCFEKGIEFIPVLSKDVENDDGSIIRAKGLDNLISKTMNKVKDAIDSQSYVYIINYIKNKVHNIFLKNNTNDNDNNNIANNIITYFTDNIGRLDPTSKKFIVENIDNLKLKCKNAKFDFEIMDFMTKFLKSIDEENEYQNDSIKQSFYEKTKNDMENKLKNIFNNGFENYIKNKLNLEINKFYEDIIKNSTEIIVENSLNDSKNLIVSKVKTAIENNPNFKNLFIISNERK